MNISLEVILAPILTLFVVQSIKLATDGIKGNFNLKGVLTSYGGMPSSHTAIVTSLCTMVAYQEGVNSIAFAIAVIFSAIVITDTLVLRKFIDQNSQAVKKLVNKLSPSEQKEFPTIITKLRHTFPQVLVGALIGFAIAFIINLI